VYGFSEQPTEAAVKLSWILENVSLLANLTVSSDTNEINTFASALIKANLSLCSFSSVGGCWIK
jgi:hypothetical protein